LENVLLLGKDMEISLSGIITAILELQLYAGSATT